jgi:hypothetical protein
VTINAYIGVEVAGPFKPEYYRYQSKTNYFNFKTLQK